MNHPAANRGVSIGILIIAQGAENYPSSASGGINIAKLIE